MKFVRIWLWKISWNVITFVVLISFLGTYSLYPVTTILNKSAVIGEIIDLLLNGLFRWVCVFATKQNNFTSMKDGWWSIANPFKINLFCNNDLVALYSSSSPTSWHNTYLHGFLSSKEPLIQKSLLRPSIKKCLFAKNWVAEKFTRQVNDLFFSNFQTFWYLKCI